MRVSSISTSSCSWKARATVEDPAPSRGEHDHAIGKIHRLVDVVGDEPAGGDTGGRRPLTPALTVI